MKNNIDWAERFRRIQVALGRTGCPASLWEVAQRIGTRYRPCGLQNIKRWINGDWQPSTAFLIGIIELEKSLSIASTENDDSYAGCQNIPNSEAHRKSMDYDDPNDPLLNMRSVKNLRSAMPVASLRGIHRSADIEALKAIIVALSESIKLVSKNLTELETR